MAFSIWSLFLILRLSVWRRKDFRASEVVLIFMFVLNSFKAKGSVKRFIKWAIWGATLFFIAQTLIDNWPAVRAIELTAQSGWWLAIACLFSLAAHGWAGWVWHWLLRAWRLPLGGLWAMRVYLFTNVAKYLPGNIWHFYARVRAVQKSGGTLGKSLASVIAEPLVMAVAAVGLGAISSLCFYLTDVSNSVNRIGSGPLWTLGLFGLWLVALLLLHPRWLNPQLAKMSRVKLNKLKRGRTKSGEALDLSSANEVRDELALAEKSAKKEPALQLERYPLLPLLGEMGFVLGRSLGFVVTAMALTPLNAADWPLLISTFSLAWVLGLIVPGAPGGIGIFEASAMVLLGSQFPEGIVLGSVACYRLVSTLAEVVGAAMVWLTGGLPER